MEYHLNLYLKLLETMNNFNEQIQEDNNLYKEVEESLTNYLNDLDDNESLRIFNNIMDSVNFTDDLLFPNTKEQIDSLVFGTPYEILRLSTRIDYNINDKYTTTLLQSKNSIPFDEHSDTILNYILENPETLDHSLEEINDMYIN